MLRDAARVFQVLYHLTFTELIKDCVALDIPIIQSIVCLCLRARVYVAYYHDASLSILLEILRWIKNQSHTDDA